MDGEQGLAQLIEALPIGVFILAADGTAIYANATAKELLGRGIGEGDQASNLGERFAAYRAGTAELYPSAEMPIVRALGGERSLVDDMEIDRHGQRVALEVTATPILDGDSRVLYAVAVFQDVTEKKRAQRALAALNEELELEIQRRTADLAQLVAVLKREIAARRTYENELLGAKSEAERANRAKSVFLMNVSHELRTPLHQIIGFSDLVTERISDERTRKLAETSAGSARELLDKVDALIELARADAAQPLPAAAEFDLHAVVTSVAATFGVPFEPDQPLGRVRGHEDGVRQVLVDVCRSCESAPGSLDGALTARRESERVVLHIPDESLARRVRALDGMFGETPQEDSSRYHQQPVDLRLAVARTHARRLGGDIIAMPGEGAVELSFSFSE